MQTIANKHISGISKDASHELSEFKRLEQTKSKINDLKHELGEVQTGTMGITGGVIPAFLNDTHMGGGSLSSFVGQFSKFNEASKHLSTMAPVLQQMANFGDKSALIPGVRSGLNTGGSVMKQATSNVPQNISGRVNHAKGIINGDSNANGGSYVNLNSAANNAYNLPLPSIGAVGTGTGGINPYTTTGGLIGRPIYDIFTHGGSNSGYNLHIGSITFKGQPTASQLSTYSPTNVKYLEPDK